MEVCKYNQEGFCKFGEKCFNVHENEICGSRNECTDSGCRKRHPKNCRFFRQFGHCKFDVTCAYSHLDDRNVKCEQLEKEVSELKGEVKTMKVMKERSESKQETEKVEKLKKEVSDLKDEVNAMKQSMKKEVCDLKGELSTMKEMFAKLYKLMNNRMNKAETDVKGKEKVPENTDESINKCKEMQTKFKCDMCEYETNKKLNLKKHVNTKHGQTDCAQATTGI